jgi:hypothetical protein
VQVVAESTAAVEDCGREYCDESPDADADDDTAGGGDD